MPHCTGQLFSRGHVVLSNCSHGPAKSCVLRRPAKLRCQIATGARSPASSRAILTTVLTACLLSPSWQVRNIMYKTHLGRLHRSPQMLCWDSSRTKHRQRDYLSHTVVPTAVPACASRMAWWEARRPTHTGERAGAFPALQSCDDTWSSLALRSVPLARQGAAGLEQLPGRAPAGTALPAGGPGAPCSARAAELHRERPSALPGRGACKPRRATPVFSLLLRTTRQQTVPRGQQEIAHHFFPLPTVFVIYTQTHELQQKQADPRSHSELPARDLRQKRAQGRRIGPCQLRGLAVQQRCCQMLAASQTCSLRLASRQDLWRSCLYEEVPPTPGDKWVGNYSYGINCHFNGLLITPLLLACCSGARVPNCSEHCANTGKVTPCMLIISHKLCWIFL